MSGAYSASTGTGLLNISLTMEIRVLGRRGAGVDPSDSAELPWYLLPESPFSFIPFLIAMPMMELRLTPPISLNEFYMKFLLVNYAGSILPDRVTLNSQRADLLGQTFDAG
jgi:hypothetical protein